MQLEQIFPTNDPKMIERFTQEIKLVRRIQHKSVVPNYDIGDREEIIKPHSDLCSRETSLTWSLYVPS